jgi:hypothetical protein
VADGRNCPLAESIRNFALGKRDHYSLIDASLHREQRTLDNPCGISLSGDLSSHSTRQLFVSAEISTPQRRDGFELLVKMMTASVT